MGEAETWVIQTADLEIGTRLGFDLMDATGRVLLKAGDPVNERLKYQLEQRNISSVTVRGAANAHSASAEAILLESFAPQSVKRFQEFMASTQAAIKDFVKNLDNNPKEQLKTIKQGINDYVTESSKDLSTSIAVMVSQDKCLDQEIEDRLASRATKLSLLGSLASISMKLPIEVSIKTSLIGLLHDTALLIRPEWFHEPPSIVRDVAFFEQYRRHPLDSAQLLNGIEGISPEVITGVTQVHEQVDGSGYPRGLMGSQIMLEAKILNFADAFLNLVDPVLGISRYLDADALAYLCHHACMGRFDREVVVAMIDSMSMYPIGSIVELEDATKVVVVQSSPGAPTTPIVRAMKEGSPRIDLQKSKHSIAAPVTSDLEQSTIRLRKHQITQVLWRTDS